MSEYFPKLQSHEEIIKVKTDLRIMRQWKILKILRM